MFFFFALKPFLFFEILQKVIEMWEIMKYMTDVPPFPRSEDPIKTRYSNSTIKAMVEQAKKYLQDR